MDPNGFFAPMAQWTYVSVSPWELSTQGETTSRLGSTMSPQPAVRGHLTSKGPQICVLGVHDPKKRWGMAVVHGFAPPQLVLHPDSCKVRDVGCYVLVHPI